MSGNNGKEMPKAYEPAAVEAKWRPTWENGPWFKGNPDADKKPYSIVIPPPNVTGILTMGHVLNNTLQDILIRRAKMLGYEACWFPGTDHAGIATESKVAQHLRKTEGRSRDDLGREEFVKRVWEWKEEYGGTIVKQLKTLGTTCAWDRARFTMDEGLSEAVQKVFVALYEKGYIHRGKRMINWCPVSRTALSDEEVIYKEVNGAFYHFKYPLSDGSGELVVATTRPETMLGDTAVAVNPNDERYKHLIGKTVDLPLTDRKIPVIADEHADPEFGTGCVKITPAHDPDDFEVGKRHGLQLIDVMNPDATMAERAGAEFAGLDRFECRKKVVKMMEERGFLGSIEQRVHSVGFSERGDVPIEPRVSEQWFVKMDELAEPAIEAVKSGKIQFHPKRWEKTYFHWMENIKDWCVSRQIWWGHRIPAWFNDETGETYVGLESPEKAGKTGKWRQDEDVLDTWFSSWLWPFSIMGWPEKTKELEFFYPTNDLVTGPDIIFFWVARMIMAGLEFTGEIPFKNVYFTSIIRDDKGRKLSKSLGNSPDPLDVIDEYGADALRFAIIYIAPLGQDILYSNDKCEIGRNFANKLWNAARFRASKGALSKPVPPSEFDEKTALSAVLESAELASTDRWILASLAETARHANRALDEFKFHEATHALYDFVWSEFCDWHIESVKQFLDSPDGEGSRKALDYAFFAILRLLHPFMPFVTEELAHNLGYIPEENVLAEYPYPDADAMRSVLPDEADLLRMMAAKFELIKAARNIRASSDIPPAKKINAFFKPADAETADFMAAEADSIKRLARMESFEIDADYAPEGPAPSAVTDAGTLFIPLEGLVDIEAEHAKLAKQKAELEKWIASSNARLSNANFTEKAPAKVVEEAKAKLEEMKAKLAKVEDSIARLG